MELEKLRQALRILSEAEKQLRSCNNKTTWLTAALLQFCPPDSVDSRHPEAEAALESSSAGTSLTQSPNAILDTSEKETANIPFYSSSAANYVKPPWDHSSQKWRQANCGGEDTDRVRQAQSFCHAISNVEGTETVIGVASTHSGSHSIIDDDYNPEMDAVYGTYPRWSPSVHTRNQRVEFESYIHKNSIVAENTCFKDGNGNKNNSTHAAPSSMDDIWKQVLKGSILNDILSRQGKLLSLSVSEAYAIAHLEFRLPEDKKRAENAKASISEAFQMVLGCPVDVQLSLASTPEAVKSDFNSRNNGFYGGALENTQIHQRKSRQRKPKKRTSRARRNQGFMAASYYSKDQSWRRNPSNANRFLDISALPNAHCLLRGSSSDESFTEWTQLYKLGPSPQALQKTRTSSMRAKSHADQFNYIGKEAYHDKFTHCALGGSYNGQSNTSDNVDDISQDLFFDASLRVERDSPNISHQSFEYEPEYDRSNMTPAFRTGFLCWKTTDKKGMHESKTRSQKARRRWQTASWVPCAS